MFNVTLYYTPIINSFWNGRLLCSTLTIYNAFTQMIFIPCSNIFLYFFLQNCTHKVIECLEFKRVRRPIVWFNLSFNEKIDTHQLNQRRPFSGVWQDTVRHKNRSTSAHVILNELADQYIENNDSIPLVLPKLHQIQTAASEERLVERLSCDILCYITI